MTTIRNRIREYRMIDPSEVAPNPRNWRLHPARQRRALRAVLEQIGIAGAVLAYYSDRNNGQLTLIDGHERMTVGVPFPALILDVTDEEADALLATYDPIGALARVDDDQLTALFSSITMPDLASIAVDLTLLPVGTPPDAPRLDMLMLRNKKRQQNRWKSGRCCCLRGASCNLACRLSCICGYATPLRASILKCAQRRCKPSLSAGWRAYADFWNC